MREVAIAGVGMTPFGNAPAATVRSLTSQAVSAALADARLGPSDVGFVGFANAAAGLLDGQEMIRGQAALRHTGLLGAPIVNVENACASGSTAFYLAWLAVASGAAEIALVVGAEKLTHPDKARSFAAIGTAIDLLGVAELRRHIGEGDAEDKGAATHSLFMDIYAAKARRFMQETGATAAHLADVVVKNRAHAAANPLAQFRTPLSATEVLTSRSIVEPLTLLMCSPIGDGAAAVVLTAADDPRSGPTAVPVLASVVTSGTDDHDRPLAGARAASQAFEVAGVGPADVDVFELHDATAPAELLLYEELGLCAPGDATRLLESGATRIGGRCPVNPSGGLLSRGHPIGATGCAQIVELTQQLRGVAGDRQVDGARIGMAHNGGGFLSTDVAVACVTILGAP